MSQPASPDPAGAVGVPPAPTSSTAFWLLTVAAGISELGTTFLNLVTPLAILAGTGSSLLAALSLGVQFAPFVFSPLLGTLIDGFDRRRVFLVSELTQGVLVAVIPVLLVLGRVELVLVLLVLASCAMVVSNLTSDFSLLPTLVPPDRVTRAYSQYLAFNGIARCAGPAVAGVVLAAVGASWALWIDAATFLFTAAVALVLPRRPRPAGTAAAVRRDFWRMQAEGFRRFRGLPGIRRITTCLSVHNLGAGALPVVIVLLVQGAWGWSSAEAGLVVAAGAAASAAGAWLAGRLGTGLSSERRIGLWFGTCAVACLALLTPWHALVVVGFCLLMVGEGGMNVTTNEYRFRAIPEEFAGRTNAVMRAFILGSAALSSVLLGWSVALPDQVLRFAPALLTSVLATALWAGAHRSRAAAVTSAS